LDVEITKVLQDLRQGKYIILRKGSAHGFKYAGKRRRGLVAPGRLKIFSGVHLLYPFLVL
jgi:hypothetical protein